MAIVEDLSGNNFGLDKRKGGKYDLPILRWQGPVQVLTAGAAAVASAAFGNTARAIRIAPIGNIHYLVGAAPVATATDQLLGGGAVEDVRIKAGEIISVIQEGSGGIVTITEDG